jgi:hypothetical protein
MGAFLGGLGAYDDISPPFASCVMVELHESSEGNYSILVFYRNDSSMDPHLLHIPGNDSSMDPHLLHIPGNAITSVQVGLVIEL